MRIHFHNRTSASRPRTGWLVLLLLLAALVPSACLVWFMNQAVRNEKLAVRQELMELYRGTLGLAQGRLDTWRLGKIREAETNHLSPPALFSSLARGGFADSIVCFDASNNVVYPSSGRVTTMNASAKSLQAEARRLHAGGKIIGLIDLVRHAETNGTLFDTEGRLIVPNLELLILEQTNCLPIRDALRDQLNDYANGMPSAQRLFVMRRFRQLFPDESFSTLNAEALAAPFLESGQTLPPGLFQVPVDRGRLLLLFTKQSAERRLPASPPGTIVRMLAPNEPVTNCLLTAPAGDAFPGWQLGLAVNNPDAFDAAARAQVASYVWVGVLTVAVVLVLALIGAQLIRRQATVARLRNDLLANVTHELKTPLASMRLLVDTLLQSRPLNEQTAREYLRLIAAENIRLSRLIDNFLTFSRIERNKHVFDFAPVPPGQIAERAAAAVRERFVSGGCRFAVQKAPGLPPVVADSDAMVTVLLNLLDNAWKYSGDDKEITLSAAAQNGSVVFAVTDNGSGLTPRETKRIFRRVYQVDQRLARSGGGCGLGLSIVKYIVDSHHGTVRVESEPGRGSTFTVTLPAAPKEVSV